MFDFSIFSIILFSYDNREVKMKHYVLAIEEDKAHIIKDKLRKEKKETGKSIRRIVTDILMSDNVFIYTKNRENREM